MDFDKTSKQDKDNITIDPTVTTRKRMISKVNKMNKYKGLNGIKIKMEEMEVAEQRVIIIITSMIVFFNYVVITLESPVVQVRIHL